MDVQNNGMRLSRLLLPALLFALCVAPLSATAGDDKYSPEELEEIVGPIALYPDVVISSMLPASTVPTDVVQAARWVAKQDGEITETPEDSGWEEAVEALVQFPDVLTWMSENLDWMEMLGYAVAVQEEDVLQAIQDFRAKANDAGNLESDEHMQVQEEDGAITIQPAQPEVIYVPTYNPVAVTQPGYTWSGWGVGLAMGAVGAWAVHGIRWGGHGYGGGSINHYSNANFNFNNNGNINTGNIGGGNRWNASNRPNQRPNTRPNQRPTNRKNNPGGARPGKGGVKPGKGVGSRPGGQRPGSRPGDRPGGSRPGSKPGGAGRPGSKPGGGAGRPGSKPGGAGRPGSKPGGGAGRPGSKPGGGATRPSTKPSGGRPSASPNRGSKSSMSGSSKNGRSTKQASSRGNRSMSGGSRPSSSSRSSGSRGGSSRSGGSRGGSRGGGRGGGGRRR